MQKDKNENWEVEKMKENMKILRRRKLKPESYHVRNKKRMWQRKNQRLLNWKKGTDAKVQAKGERF